MPQPRWHNEGCKGDEARRNRHAVRCGVTDSLYGVRAVGAILFSRDPGTRGCRAIKAIGVSPTLERTEDDSDVSTWGGTIHSFGRGRN